jgi:lipopolysaccharide/colanic/teichoic acid biosynthesis glycosyltransferase
MMDQNIDAHINTKRARADVGHLSTTYKVVKRAFDFVASAAGLIILAIPFLIIGIIIKLDDPEGGVFYSQTRLGKDGKEFRMWKFRSMVANADKLVDKLLEQNEVEGAMFKIKDDPRITKIGAFLRKYSLDELPQLYNILCGDMSLVGPRPPLPREVAEYTPYDMQRLAVIPGATGLWQVSGRSDVGFDEMVDLDIKYINSASIWNDIKILLKTVVIVIRPNGAY